MIGPTQNQQPATAPQTPVSPPAHVRNVLTMVPSDRMAGAIPVWGAPRTGKDGVSGAMAYTAQNNGSGSGDDEFTFHDVLNMINPLQHIPIVNRIYRHITG